MRKLLILVSILLPVFSFGQDSLRVMFYNLYRFPVNAPANREYLLEQIVDSAQPDLLMACEIVNEDGSNRILNTSFGDMSIHLPHRNLFIAPALRATLCNKWFITIPEN